MYYNEDNMQGTEKNEPYFYGSEFLQFQYQFSLIMADNNFNIDSKLANLMYKSGFDTKDITNLCKDERFFNTMQVSFNNQGLGYTKSLSEYSKEPEWNFDNDEIEINEKVDWLRNNNFESFSIEECRPIEGSKLTYVDITEFCDVKVFHQVFKAKELFDRYDHKVIYDARYRSNPFELIKSGIFMNRAALKMASIDAATDFMFTNMEKQKDFSLPIYFADVCAGPGGFSEYLFWRREWDYKGFGLTLSGPDDFKLQGSKCASFVSFQALYGRYNDGDVCNPENIYDFVDKVRNETEGLGVHFMMSDGGFSVEGHEELQEVASKNIYLCQCYLALEALRPHGSFVTKLFDLFTPFSVGLLYLMYSCFEQVSILKPNTSRSANSERYFICNDLRNDARTHNIRQYLSSIVKKLWDYGGAPEKDVLELVPLDVIKKDSHFFDYVYKSNVRIAKKQIDAFAKMAIFCENPLLSDPRQFDLKQKCLEYWDVPDHVESDDSMEPEILRGVFNIFSNALNRDYPRLLKSNLLSTVRKMTDYFYCFLSDTKQELSANFYFALNNKVYEISKSKYSQVNGLYLANNTLIYGEILKEYQEDGIKSRDSLHILDAVSLGTRSLEDCSFKERSELIQRFCKAHNKESDLSNCCRIRPKLFKRFNCLKNDLPSNGKTPFDVELSTLGYQSQKEVFKANSVLIYNPTEKEFFDRFSKRYVVYNNDDDSVHVLRCC
ncbi:cap-specific mRNA (nucleoside-2'-O-)-methyltransferase 1-like isoform X3 [Rhynchophorus ferrugineus]|uniref:cap-specific mRNA (nucleoside-2'-O-)-methyltransferase 1-like isoform X3 n=2 Tax=Rhynchophorus ferrugineus TaxID=354439 RepID=UPI003FCD3E2A